MGRAAAHITADTGQPLTLTPLYYPPLPPRQNPGLTRGQERSEGERVAARP